MHPGRIGEALPGQVTIAGHTFSDTLGAMDNNRSVFEITDGYIIPALAAVQRVLPGEDEAFNVVGVDGFHGIHLSRTF